MILNQITLQNYRNIGQLTLPVTQNLTVICGENGQGKTNLMEGIWLLTGSKSFRGAKDGELVQKGCDTACVSALCRAGGREQTIELVIQPACGRTARVNGVDRGRASRLAGLFTAVVFSPDHLSLVKGPPDNRRRFTDAALCQLYPEFLSVLRRYTRLITQKNALLREHKKTGRLDVDLLDVLDTSISDTGVQLSVRRQAYCAELMPRATAVYRAISRGREELSFGYQGGVQSPSQLAELLRASRSTDLRAGFCTAGPHREDLQLLLGGEDTRLFASQGQVRSIVLSLKLAEADCVRAITGEYPVMLLDDVLSELDSNRQDYLLNQIEDKQVFVTSCDADLFVRTSGKICRMEQGRLLGV